MKSSFSPFQISNFRASQILDDHRATVGTGYDVIQAASVDNASIC
jgi:hypothetical protein